MSDRFPHASESVFAVVVILLLICAGCGGGGSANSNSRVPPPAGPPAISSLSLSSGVVGQSIKISGSNFGAAQGSSTVTFNGTAAGIGSWTNSLIAATVPPGASNGNVVVTVGSSASNGVSFTVLPLSAGSIAPTNFGFQCGPGDPADCQGPGGLTDIVWPSTSAQPQLLRLHDAGTQWANMNSGDGTYNWQELDAWLDLLAKHSSVQVSQVFTWVPCWAAPAPCTQPPTAPNGTSTPPSDLGSGPQGSSPAFNKFVTAFVTHCSNAGNCVNKIIKYYEMWNEWDISYHWTGTMAQVYQLVAYPTSIIRQNVPGAVIMTPSSTPFGDTGLPYQCDLQNWLNYETANGIISDWVAWHDYLTKNDTTTVAPEIQFQQHDLSFLSVKNGGAAPGCTGNAPVGWSNAPWANTETNFDGAPPPGLNYTCPAAQFSASDCTGQIVRWQLLHDSYGSSGLYWYKWNETIGANPQYESAYFYMMQYLVGGKFDGSSPCQAITGTTVWTCPFTKLNGKSALWVWTTDESPTTFQVPSGAGYSDYSDLTGTVTPVSDGQSISISVMPIMLEQ